HRAHIGEDGALDILLLGRGLDDEIAVSEGVERLGRRDALERGLPFLFSDAIATHLARHVAVDGRNAGLDAVGVKIIELDVESGPRADIADAAALCPGADPPFLANMNRVLAGAVFWALFPLYLFFPPFLPRPPPQRHVLHDRQRPSLPNSAANSGSAW